MFHGGISLNSVLLLLLLNFVTRFKLELMYVSLSIGPDRLIISVNRFFKLPDLHMLMKQKSPSLSRNLGLWIFGKSPIVFSTKVNLQHLLHSTTQRSCLLQLTKQNCLLKTFLRTLILITQVSYYLFSLLKLI